MQEQIVGIGLKNRRRLYAVIFLLGTLEEEVAGRILL